MKRKFEQSCKNTVLVHYYTEAEDKEGTIQMHESIRNRQYHDENRNSTIRQTPVFKTIHINNVYRAT